MIGVTLVLFLTLEGLYRAQSAVRASLKGARRSAVDSTLHPYAREPWWGPFQGRDGLQARKNRFDPYRAFWGTPAESRYVNVDSMGRRVTPQAPPVAASRPRQVFMLGGSTMWGYTARDSFSIPALVASEIRARGVTDVEVVNLAQGAYNTTQEANTLLLELAHTRVPAAVVALDGYNDAATAYKYGEAGHTYGEAGIAQQIELGTRGFWGELIGLGRHSALVGRLREAVGIAPPPSAPQLSSERICAETARYYHATARAMDALGREWGFPVVHILQPFQSASHKAPTAWEKQLGGPAAWAECARAIEVEMSERGGGANFVSLTGMFDAETATVFVDANAHVTEQANRQVAARIAELVVPLLQQTAPRSPEASIRP